MKFLSFYYLLLLSSLSFSQLKEINYTFSSGIELKENSDELENYLSSVWDKFGKKGVIIVVFFDTKNDKLSSEKFDQLIKDSILIKKNDVQTHIILQEIPSEYKFTDLKGNLKEYLSMPSHNILIYAKDKKYLHSFMNRMRERITKMNIWQINFHQANQVHFGYIFERIAYGGTCLPDEEMLMIRSLSPLFFN